jgi:hypothetical protein
MQVRSKFRKRYRFEGSSRVEKRSPTSHRALHCEGAQLHEPHLDTEVVPLAKILISH